MATSLLFGLNSCKKKEEARTTGGLVVKVKLASSTGFLTGAYVGLATSQENLDNNVYLQQKGTNSSGSADFGQLNPGNYYYECATEIAGTIYAGEGQVQITADKDLELTLEIR